MLHCSPLSKLHAYADEIKAGYLISLLSEGTPVTRPARIAPANWLNLTLNDVVAVSPGLIPPGEVHVDALLAFITAWPQDEPLLIHCWAGVSRSTASTFIAACVLRPEIDEATLAARLRWASPSATPNRRLVEIADAKLQRDGRMVRAIDGIGRGADCFEGNTFQFDLD